MPRTSKSSEYFETNLRYVFLYKHIETSFHNTTFPQNSLHFSGASKGLFSVFIRFWRSKRVLMRFLTVKTHTCLIMHLSAISISSAMEHLLFQKAEERKMEIEITFTWRQSISSVTWRRKTEMIQHHRLVLHAV